MKSKVIEQTILQKIQPQCESLYIHMKEAKEVQHKTNQDIADNTGVSISNVGKFFSDTLERPCVFNVAAVCIYLGLSLDKLLGISDECTSDSKEIIKALESENKELKLHLEYSKKECENFVNLAKYRGTIITALLFLCAVMTISTCVFIFIDRSIPDQGLFQANYTSPVGIGIVAIIALSVLALVAHIIKKLIKGDDKNG